jgi:hypothetical protein
MRATSAHCLRSLERPRASYASVFGVTPHRPRSDAFLMYGCWADNDALARLDARHSGQLAALRACAEAGLRRGNSALFAAAGRGAIAWAGALPPRHPWYMQLPYGSSGADEWACVPNLWRHVLPLGLEIVFNRAVAMQGGADAPTAGLHHIADALPHAYTRAALHGHRAIEHNFQPSGSTWRHRFGTQAHSSAPLLP